MEFKKYPSIENHYRDAEINRWLKYFPELEFETFILTEKLHGCNFSILITKDTIEFGKRTSILEEDEKFYGYKGVMKQYETEINKFKTLIGQSDIETIRVFGEMFGSNIQKGVFYSNEKQFRIFDIYINNELLTQEGVINLLDVLGISHMFVPIVAIVEGLKNALDYDIRFNSILHKTEDINICEGVVIKPYSHTYLNEDSPFYIKKKNKEFNEKQKESKSILTDDELRNVQNIFKSYLTENRVESVISKYGELTDMKQIGEYIKYVLEDAKEDFFKDYNEVFMSLEEKKRSKVFGVGGVVIVPMLQKYL